MIAVIDYEMGNVGSILNMLQKLGTDAVLTDDNVVIGNADKLILPGVGAFDRGMENLKRKGLVQALHRAARDNEKPILGICLGMQLLARGSEEGRRSGLGWLDADVVKFRFDSDSGIKVPQMGWNQTQIVKAEPLFSGLESGSRFYFVHSYYMKCEDQRDVAATTYYGHDFVSAVQHNRIYGTQFHPEKSHKFGLALLRNFVEQG